MRFRDYWKTILVFCVSFLFAFLSLRIEGELFGTEVSGILFAITGTLVFVSGLWLILRIYADISHKKMMEREPTQEELEMREKESGRLRVDQDKIQYFYGADEPLFIKLSELKIVGEFTNESGPNFDDWFLIFVTTNNDHYYIPAYAFGFQEAIDKLSEVLGEKIIPQLFSSTTFNSAVLFPKSLKDRKLFDFEGLHPKGFWSKLKSYIGWQSVTPILRKDILEYKK